MKALDNRFYVKFIQLEIGLLAHTSLNRNKAIPDLSHNVTKQTACD